VSPFAGPPAWSPGPENPRESGKLGPVMSMKDPRPVGRVSSRLVAEVAGRLSDRDREALRLVGRFRVMSGAQLARLLWVEGKPATRARLARRQLARLVDLGVLERLPRRVGGVRAGSSGLVFAAGRVGQRLLRAEPSGRRVRRAYAPGPRYLAHALGLVDLYVALIEAQRWGVVDGVLAFDPEPACWRSYPGPYGARLTAKPDGFVRLAAGDFELSWFIEVDMASEAPVTLTGKARTYIGLYRSGVEQASHGVFPRVAWIAPDEARAEAIRRTLAGLADHHELFAITTAREAVALLAAETGP
jgi:Replication-relaxation